MSDEHEHDHEHDHDEHEHHHHDGPHDYVGAIQGYRAEKDAFFQDSSTLPAGGRQATHEYTLTAQADLETGALQAVHPVPRVLPYGECPLAVTHVDALAGLPLRDLRGAVLERLRGPLGCTHLNDMLPGPGRRPRPRPGAHHLLIRAEDGRTRRCTGVLSLLTSAVTPDDAGARGAGLRTYPRC